MTFYMNPYDYSIGVFMGIGMGLLLSTFIPEKYKLWNLFYSIALMIWLLKK